MNIYWKLGSYVIAIAVFVAGLAWYGHKKYDQGYEQYRLEAQAEAARISEQYRAKEAVDRKKAQDEYAKYQAEKAKTEAAMHDLGNLYSGLQRDVASYKRRLSEASANPAGAIKTGSAGIDNYQSCANEYRSMGTEYAEVADRLNGLLKQCNKEE